MSPSRNPQELQAAVAASRRADVDQITQQAPRLAVRAANPAQARMKQSDFPVHKNINTFDLAAVPGVSKNKDPRVRPR